MLDGVEPDRAQSQGVLDSAADVGQPKVLEEPQDLHILAGPGFPQPGLQEPPQPEIVSVCRRNSSGSAHPVSGAA